MEIVQNLSCFLFILLHQPGLCWADQNTFDVSTGSITDAGSISVSKPYKARSSGYHVPTGSSQSIKGAINPPLPFSDPDPITRHSMEILTANGFSHGRLSTIAHRYQVVFLNDSNIRYSSSNETRNTSQHSATCPESMTLWVPAVFGQYTISQHLVLNPFLQAPQLAIKHLFQTSPSFEGAEEEGMASFTKNEECHYQPRDKGLFATFALDKALGSLKGTFEIDELPGETIIMAPLNKKGSSMSIKTTNPSLQQKLSISPSENAITEVPSSAHLLYIIKKSAQPSHTPKDNTDHRKNQHLSQRKHIDEEEDVDNDDHDHCGVYTGVEGGSTIKSHHRPLRHNKRHRHKLRLDPEYSKGNSIARTKRSLLRSSGALKWLELALIFDTTLTHLLNTTSSSQKNKDIALEYALAITNLIDQVFQPLKIRVVLSYVEVWNEHDQVHILHNDAGATLLNVMSYTADNLFTIPFDSLQLLLASQEASFAHDQYGTASVGSICSLKSVGVTTVGLDVLSAAVRVSHMIAHNLGISHDSSHPRDCICPADEGCLMRHSYRRLGETARRRPVFSSCSQDDLLDTLQRGAGTCLVDSPFPGPVPDPAALLCGNGVVDPDEDCDCGADIACLGRHSCCDPLTCRLVDGAQCSHGPCCTPECKFKTAGTLCREEADDCDLPEYCSGVSSHCPLDGFQRNGELCDDKTSYCFNRTCVGRDEQCHDIWGPDSKQAALECTEHISVDSDAGICGLVHCQGGALKPLPVELQGYSPSITHVTINPGKSFQCKTLQPSATLTWPDSAWTKDGSKCGHNRICLHQACISIHDITPPAQCPSNKPSTPCSGQGECNDLNECSCDTDFHGADCSQLSPRARPRGVHSRYYNSSAIDQENLEAWKKNVLAHNLNLQSSAMTSMWDNFMMLLIMAGLIALFLLMFMAAMIFSRVPTEPGQEQLLDSPHAGSATGYEDGSPSTTDSPSAANSYASSTAHLTRNHHHQRSRTYHHPHRAGCRAGGRPYPTSHSSQYPTTRPPSFCRAHGHVNPHYENISPEELPTPHFTLYPDSSPSTVHHCPVHRSHHSSLNRRHMKPTYGSTLPHHPSRPSSAVTHLSADRSSSLQDLLRQLGNYHSTQSPTMQRETSIRKTVRSVQVQTVGDAKMTESVESDHMPPVMRELNITRMLSCEFHDVDTLACYDTVNELEQVWKPRDEMRIWRNDYSETPWSCPPLRRPFLQLDQLLLRSPEPEETLEGKRNHTTGGYFSVGCQSVLSDEATTSSTDKSSLSCSHSA